MSVLAFPGLSVPVPTPARRRHLSLVPSELPSATPERDADILPLPVRPVPARPARPARVAARRVAAPAAPAAASTAPAPLRLTVRGRRVLVALVLAAATALGSLLGSVVSAGADLPSEVASVTVQSGETLWSIAAAATPAGADVREVMSQIVALNGLESQALAAGQVLTVPAAG